MTETGNPIPNPAASEPPEAFIAQVRDGLLHLYDMGYLQLHPLALPGASGGQQLKRLLMETVEDLNPGPAFYFRAPQARPYNMLLLHYIERVTIQKAATELGISERQAYRELRDGETSAARLLWAKYAPRQETPLREADAAQYNAAQNYAAQDSAAPEVPGQEMAGIRPAAAQGSARPAGVRLGDLLEGAAATVRRLASQAGIQIRMELQAQPEVRDADQAAVRQILVSLLSRVVQAAAGDVCIRAVHDRETVFLSFSFAAKDQPGGDDLPVDDIVQQLLRQVGWQHRQTRGEQGEQHIELRLASSAQTIVLIDDDEGFAGLLNRYINRLPFRLVTAQSGLEGIETVRSTRPALILLDVMMPGLDGWETLQRLQTDPETMGIPLIICSVFNDPELARSLGARLLLPKPVSREAFLAALETIGVLSA